MVRCPNCKNKIKSEDDLEMSQIAEDNTLFVEDAVRLISQELDNHQEIIDWIVRCIHQESIHATDAFAMNWKGVDGGFNGREFMV